MMKNGRTIRIKSGVVNIPVVEHINTEKEFEASIFTEQYVQALDALNNLVVANRPAANSRTTGCRRKNRPTISSLSLENGDRAKRPVCHPLRNFWHRRNCMKSKVNILLSRNTSLRISVSSTRPISTKRTISWQWSLPGFTKLTGISSNTNTPNPDVSTYSENWSRLSPGTTQHAMSAGKKRDNRRV